MKQVIKLEEFTMEHLHIIAGMHDENLKMIEETLQVSLSLRGDELFIEGEQEQSFDEAKQVIDTLLAIVKKGIKVTKRDVVYALNLSKKDNLNKMEELYSIKIAKTMSGKLIYPKTMGQKIYYNALQKKDVVFGIGPAGTGKTYLAVVFAVTALKNNQVKKIILTRPAVEAGENLGFLPGDLKEKVDPYLRPLYDALHDMLGVEQTERMIEKGLIEIAPLAYMRGRTLEDAYVILDEAQNTTDNQMKMFLTRLGFNSKMVITGDITQIDLPKGITSGLQKAIQILEEVKGIQFVYLTAMDVVRHPVVQRIIERYEGK